MKQQQIPPIDERALRQSLHDALDDKAPTSAWRARVLASAQARRAPHLRVGMAVLLCAVLALGMAVASAVIWPDEIRRIFSGPNISSQGQGALTTLDAYGGNEVIAQTEANGIALRTHYMISDGTELSVLFSMQNAKDDLPSLADAQLMVTFSDDAAGGSDLASNDTHYDPQTGTLYCLATATLRDASLAPAQLAEGQTVRLDVATMKPMPPAMHPLCDLTPEAVAALPLGTELAPEDSHAASLILHEASLADGRLRIRYTLAQKNGGGGDNIANKAYLIPVTDPRDIPPLPMDAGYPIVYGEGTLDLPVPEGGVLMLVSDEATHFVGDLTGWTLDLPVTLSEAVPVTEIPLDRTIVAGDIPIRLDTAFLRPTGIILTAHIAGEDIPAALLDTPEPFARGSAVVSAVRDAVYNLRLDFAGPDGPINARISGQSITYSGADSVQDIPIQIKYGFLDPALPATMEMTVYHRTETQARLVIPLVAADETTGG